MKKGQQFEATTRLGEKETYEYIGKIPDMSTYDIGVRREDGSWFTVEEEWFNQRKIKVLG